MKKEKIQRVRIGQIGSVILGVLLVTSVAVTFATLPGLTYAVAPFLKKRGNSYRREVTQNTESLLRSRLIERYKKSDGEFALRLTRMGRLKAFLAHGVIASRTKSWDRIWRIIIFDIPNEKGKIRAVLRNIMKKFGFIMIQKSVWVYPYECDDFVEVIKSALGVSHDVLYIKAQYVENQQHLMRQFKL